MKLYILMKWNALSLVDSSEHFLFSFQLAKTFGNTSFVSVKYQFSSEFSQIGMPHFSLEGVITDTLCLGIWQFQKKCFARLDDNSCYQQIACLCILKQFPIKLELALSNTFVLLRHLPSRVSVSKLCGKWKLKVKVKASP